MLKRPVLRWLLRVLGDDAFLPIYLGDGTRRPPPETQDQLQVALEHAFWSLAWDYERPKEARRPAWDELQSMIDRIGARDLPVPSFFGQLVTLLYREMNESAQAELARFWAWPELVDASPTQASARGYYEIHAHLRGSVPIDRLWCWLLSDARARACLRGKDCEVGLWKRTRAELVDLASRLRPQGFQGHEDEARLRRYCMRLGDLPSVQYLALLANFRRFMLHQRGRSGLVSFSKSFDGISKLTKRGRRGHAQRRMDREAVVAALERFEDAGARAVELRPTLEPTYAKNVDKLKTLVLGYFDYLEGHMRRYPGASPRSSPLVMGLVPSLYKQEAIGDAKHHGCASDDDLRGRLEQQQHVWQRQVESVLQAIRTVPLLRMFVVGLDGAGLEMGAPVRALAPAFKLVHEHHHRWNLVGTIRRRVIPAADLQRKLTEIRGARPPGAQESPVGDELWNALDFPGMDRWVEHRRLGLTVHAGEDFIDPTTGLREIWEAIEHLGLDDHDRIGHAIALSLDAKRLRKLLQRRGESTETSSVQSLGPGRWRLRKPSGVHALDLAWSASMLGSPDRIALAHATSRALGVLPMHRAVHESLSNDRFPSSAMLPGVCFRDHETLEPELLCWIEIDDAWCACYEDLRQRVIAKARSTGIVIESCPTSNCTVANLDDPPLFGLLEIDPEIHCAVATDDPGVLDAWPEDELARVDAHPTRAAQYRARLLRTNAQASFVR